MAVTTFTTVQKMSMRDIIEGVKAKPIESPGVFAVTNLYDSAGRLAAVVATRGEDNPTANGVAGLADVGINFIANPIVLKVMLSSVQ